MELLTKIKNVREVGTKHFDELKSDLIAYNPSVELIDFMKEEGIEKKKSYSKFTKQELTFWGLDSSGWVRYFMTVLNTGKINLEEDRIIAKYVGEEVNIKEIENLQLISEVLVQKMTDEDIEEYITSRESSMEHFFSFIEKYDDIKSEYKDEFES